MMPDDASRQREYYARTAAQYNAMHVADEDEHSVAIAAFAGIARMLAVTSILDVGAGTGRAVRQFGKDLPGVRVVGVEPVGELREVGHRDGVPEDQLVDGDALALPFADDSFDFVVETAVLHHVADPALAVREMLRVARMGVMISDANKFGQGSFAARSVKRAVRMLGLWNTMIRLQTRGKMSKWSEGDGLYYSYSIFDNIGLLNSKFPRQFLMNTQPLAGTDLRFGAAQVMVIATR